MDELARRNDTLALIEEVDANKVQETMKKIASFQAVVRANLVEGHDFGTIPGTGDKPTLLKPGAEKLVTLLGLTTEYEQIEKVQDYEKGFFAFTIRCILSRQGYKITEGFGHANTRESRYAARWVTEKNLPDGVRKEDCKSREFNGKYGKYYKYLVENEDIYTQVNTVLKMAKKRALVDASLTAGSLSDIFTQDLEDMAGEAVQQSQQKQSQQKQAGNRTPAGGKSDAAKEKKLEQLYKAAENTGKSISEMKALIKERYNKDSSKKLTAKEIDELIIELGKGEMNQQGLTEEEMKGAAEAISAEDAAEIMDGEILDPGEGPDF